jgi:hypothetical protein
MNSFIYVNLAMSEFQSPILQHEARKSAIKITDETQVSQFSKIIFILRISSL